MTAGPLVSVIVPVYNSASTIDRALASVLAQSYGNWELLVVDDASTDDSARRARAVAASVPDRPVRVIDSPENRGSSAARNTGLDAAAGEFVAFLDADDELLPDYLEALTSACDADTDIVVCGHVVSVDGSEDRPRASRDAGRMDGRTALRAALADRITPFPWDKLYRRSLFDGLRYPEGLKRFEDMVVNLALYPRARHVVVLQRPLYRYRISAGSLTWGRVPSRDDVGRALSYLDLHLDAAFRHGRFQAPYQATLTLLTLLTAQSAATSGSTATGRLDLRQYGADLTLGRLAGCARARPDLAAAGILLKVAPALFGAVYRRYARRSYGAE
ncbi:glycosyltransferase family 2 protein [Arthrobacter burdickii]|uniref:Glycosyltransferase family 2 protein n=1 Tax=Arthrobacter burdickii TaxID=3035920 RepID=A0ABT8K2J5_9MICC|nr:glycosyltransferase family 2 protein [Arthrobacter burdickii]MDN4611056.1 glycosyltransferase family 2 protein [Arthrobacter burdickii]